MKTAILVDGGFYRRRAQAALGDKTPAERADELEEYCIRHLKHKNGSKDYLYRIFYYDCQPTAKCVYHPLKKSAINMKQTELYAWANEFFDELKCKRKFALRFGRLAEEQAYFSLNKEIVKKICDGSLDWDDIKETDFSLSIEQKGVDMKIGLDIASLAYKKQVDRIILISGDSDFVPAAKLARREGIDFVLDPLGSKIKPDLLEHIDGLSSCDKVYTSRVK